MKGGAVRLYRGCRSYGMVHIRERGHLTQIKKYDPELKVSDFISLVMEKGSGRAVGKGKVVYEADLGYKERRRDAVGKVVLMWDGKRKGYSVITAYIDKKSPHKRA